METLRFANLFRVRFQTESAAADDEDASSVHAARDNKTLDGVDAATVLEQFHYWLRYSALFVRFPLASSSRRWLGDARTERDINLLQIHYISLHILAKSSVELSLIEACFRCSFSDRNNKSPTKPVSDLRVIHHREFFARWWPADRRIQHDGSAMVAASLVVHFAISSYLISRKCKIFPRLSLCRVFARV